MPYNLDDKIYFAKPYIVIEKKLEDHIKADNPHKGTQATLVSGANIKTINDQSLLGSGDIHIETDPVSVDDFTAGLGIEISEDEINNTVLVEVDNEVIPLKTDLSSVAFSGNYNDLSNKPYIPVKTSDLDNDSGFITGITSSDVTSALGYTPYDSSNPNGYITSSALNGYATEQWVTSQGYVTSDYHDSSKQDVLTAGSGINITNNIISCTLNGVSYSIVNSYGDLPRPGVVGTFYLIPNGESGEPNTYDEYIWVEDKNDFEFIGTTAIDLSNYGQLDGNNTWTGDNTFSNSIKINNNEIVGSPGQGGLAFYLNNIRRFNIISDCMYPQGSMDLGYSSFKWRDLYLAGKINPNGSNYGLSLPDTTSFTANKEIAIKDDVGAIAINAPSSTTLTDAEYAVFTSGKIIKVNGTLLGYYNPVFFPCIVLNSSAEVLNGFCSLHDIGNRATYIKMYEINTNTKTISINDNASYRYIYLSGIGNINNKNVPAYPTLATGNTPKVLTYKDDNTMAWTDKTLLPNVTTDDNEKVLEVIGSAWGKGGKKVNRIDAPSSTVLTDEEFDKIISGIFINGDFLGYKNPILSPATYVAGESAYFGNFLSIGSNGVTIYCQYKINDSKVISLYSEQRITMEPGDRKLTIEAYTLSVRGKTIPPYPTTNTSPQYLQIGANGGNLSWSDIPKELPASLGTAGQVLKVNANADGVEWGNDNDTKYSSLTEASGGTDVSLVTTGEKYNWNHILPQITSSDYSKYLHVDSNGGLEWASASSDNQTIKVSGSPEVSFGANDVVEFVSGANVSLIGDSNAKTITINSKDTNYYHTPIFNSTNSLKIGTSTGDQSLADLYIPYNGANQPGVMVAGTGLTATANSPVVNVDPSYVALQTDLPSGEVNMNINDSTTTATSATLSNIVVGDSTNGYTRYNVSAGMTNPMTTSQDIIVGGTSVNGVATPTRLAKGNNGELLRVNSSGNLAYGNNLPIITTAPSADNTDGLIICVLSSEPATKYNGYLYIITGSAS